MKCHELLKGLNEYVDGETRSALCRAIREHLAGCDSCRVVIDNIRQTITLYRAGRVSPLPGGLHEKLHGILRDRWTTAFPHASPR